MLLTPNTGLPYPADWALESRRPLKKVSKDFACHPGKLPANILSGFPSSSDRDDGPDNPGDPHEEPFRRAASLSTALAEGTAPRSPHTPSVAGTVQWIPHPDISHPETNSTHMYVSTTRTKTLEDDDGSNYKPITESDRKHARTTSGQVYKTWRYLSAVV
ncbi:unnamed protein product [Penicillium discolor]